LSFINQNRCPFSVFAIDLSERFDIRDHIIFLLILDEEFVWPSSILAHNSGPSLPRSLLKCCCFPRASICRREWQLRLTLPFRRDEKCGTGSGHSIFLSFFLCIFLCLSGMKALDQTEDVSFRWTIHHFFEWYRVKGICRVWILRSLE
jgi:hypothetical protein